MDWFPIVIPAQTLCLIKIDLHILPPLEIWNQFTGSILEQSQTYPYSFDINSSGCVNYNCVSANLLMELVGWI